MRASMGGAHKLRLLFVTLLTGLIGSCVDSSEPNSPPTSASKTAVETAGRASPSRGIDAEFTRLAREIPGFGGMYYDQAGRLNVYMTGPQGGVGARSADVARLLRTHGGAALQRRLSKSGPVVTHAAKYDYLQLQAYRARLTGISGVRGLVYIDTDEERNRLRIAIQPGAPERDVIRELARAGVPRDVVIISRSAPIVHLKNLHDRFRPVPGGVQIVFPAPSVDPNAFFVCSLAFNARIASQPNSEFFVTASHCSDVQGGNQGTPYYQPSPKANPAANRIAFEFRDPRYGDAGDNCIFYPGSRCRFSDALLARYVGGVNADFGTVARTTFARQRIGSLKIDDNRPRWSVVGELPFPLLGEIVHKVGRTTGWTKGPVIGTCIDTFVGGTDIVQICQDFAFTFSLGGDSGSSVFEQVGPNQIVLAGVLWGGPSDGSPIIVFSSMENIEHELGQLMTSNSSLVASAP